MRRSVVLWILLLALSTVVLPALALAQAPCNPTTTLKTGAGFSWTPPVQPANVTTTGYGMDQQIDNGPWTQLADLAVNSASTSVANLPPNHSYTFRLYTKARLQNGDSGVSGYATYRTDGTQQPCFVITIVNAPSNFSAVQQ